MRLAAGGSALRDRRGWGRSTANPDTGPQPGTIAEDLHGLVEHLKIDRFHLIGVAGGIGLLAGGALTAFLILALDGVMPNWLAALLVGAAYAVVAAVLFSVGKNRVQEAGPLVPEQTVNSVKEDVQWAKTQIGSDSN